MVNSNDLSWCHDDLIREAAGIYDTLQPQEKMARCKIRRQMQLKRWHEYDRLFDDEQKFRKNEIDHVNNEDYSFIFWGVLVWLRFFTHETKIKFPPTNPLFPSTKTTSNPNSPKTNPAF